jgi:hypothetical protein
VFGLRRADGLAAEGPTPGLRVRHSASDETPSPPAGDTSRLEPDVIGVRVRGNSMKCRYLVLLMPWSTILLCSLLLSVPALVNGYPLVWSDSGTYVGQAITLTGSTLHPPYYSLFLFPLHLRLSLWPIVFAQGIFVSIILYLIVKVIGYKRPLLFLAALTAILTLFTSLPWLSSEILTDVFAGLVILVIFMLACTWDRLRTAERWFLVVGLTIMLCFHPTFPALTILVTGFVSALNLVRRAERIVILRTLMVLLGPAWLALLAMVVYSEALIHHVAIVPDGPSLVLAKVIADGPGRVYLHEACDAGANYELCAYIDKMPTDEMEFLYSNENPWGKVIRKVGIEGARIEASNIVMNAIRRYPLWQIEQSINNFARQLTMFRGIELPLCSTADNGEQLTWCLKRFHITEVVSKYFPSEIHQFMTSLQNSNRLPMGFLYSVDEIVVIISAIFCVTMAYRWWWPGGRPEPLLSDLLGVIIVGVVSNAAVTGILSEPMDRYGGRVIWLLPFFVVLVFGQLTVFHPQPQAA